MADQAVIKELEYKALIIRKELLNLCATKSIHIGGDLSVVDVMVAIWQYAMKYDVKNPKWENRDRFVLSKGHAAAVTTLNQAILGCYTREEVFEEYGTDYGRFGMHSCNLENPYVEVSTGSLGHGLPVGAGIAAALRLKRSARRVFVVMGDGELAEGSMWEAVMSAPNMKLGNLVGLVDRNGCSLDNECKAFVEPLEDKWRAFGWRVVTVDGHDMNALVDALDSLPDPACDTPIVIIANTVKGKGVPQMENDLGWHYGGITEELAEEAKARFECIFKEKWRCIV